MFACWSVCVCEHVCWKKVQRNHLFISHEGDENKTIVTKRKKGIWKRRFCAWYAVSRFFLISQKQTPFPLILPPSNPQKQQAIRLPTALSFSFYRFVYTLPSSHSLSLFLLSFRCSSSPYIRHISFQGLVHDRGGFNFYSIKKEMNSSYGSLLNSLYILYFLSALLSLHHVLTSSIDYPCHCWRCSTSPPLEHVQENVFFIPVHPSIIQCAYTCTYFPTCSYDNFWASSPFLYDSFYL